MPHIYNKRKGSPPAPDDAVYVGRPTKWGNPWVVGKDGTRADCVRNYMIWAYAPEQAAFRAEVRVELGGKDLVCWCWPNPCHAEVLLRIAND